MSYLREVLQFYKQIQEEKEKETKNNKTNSIASNDEKSVEALCNEYSFHVQLIPKLNGKNIIKYCGRLLEYNYW